MIGEIVRGERLRPVEIPAGKEHGWKFSYTPPEGEKRAVFSFSLGEWSAKCEIVAEHFADGATFTHFGILPIPKTWDSPGKAYLDDVVVNGTAFDFSRDPKWDSLNNRRYYLSGDTRPRFDFGFSRSRFAGGKNEGELGGLIFRGDCREAGRMACYGDKVGPLSLENKLVARGKVAMLRGISDATASIGFYHSEHSMKVNPSQKSSIPSDFIGINIEGPSAEGFFFYPVYRAHDGDGKALGDNGRKSPRIYPDAKSIDWEFVYDPASGEIKVTLGGQSCSMMVEAADRKAGATFNRFGIVTPWIDGNSVTAFFDDLEYTADP